MFGLEEKAQRRGGRSGRVNPFVDPDGYQRFVDRAEQAYLKQLAQRAETVGMSPDDRDRDSSPPVLLSFRDVLRIPVMRRVWYAQVVSLFGDFLALFAVIAVVSFRMHGTAAQLTGLQIAYMLPIVFVGPVAGVFVDRWPLKPTLISSDLIRAGLALLLIPATSVWQVYGVLAALSCVSAFFGPAQTVTIRSHVPVAGLMSANALMQIAFMGSRIVGPATAGAIVARVHAAGLLLDRRGELPGVGEPDRVGGDRAAGVAAGADRRRRATGFTRSGST